MLLRDSRHLQVALDSNSSDGSEYCYSMLEILMRACSPSSSTNSIVEHQNHVLDETEDIDRVHQAAIRHDGVTFFILSVSQCSAGQRRDNVWCLECLSTNRTRQRLDLCLSGSWSGPQHTASRPVATGHPGPTDIFSTLITPMKWIRQRKLAATKARFLQACSFFPPLTSPADLLSLTDRHPQHITFL